MCFKHKVVRLAMTIMIVAVFIVSSACGISRYRPRYILKCARDNGFVAAYRAYYTIDEDTVKKISKFKYENYIYNDNNYKAFNAKFSNYDVDAKSSNPSDWTYELKYHGNEQYDTNDLINRLQSMNVSYIGSMFILVQWFDEYEIISVTYKSDKDSISEYAVFRNGIMLDIPKNTDLSSIRTYYRYN